MFKNSKLAKVDILGFSLTGLALISTVAATILAIFLATISPHHIEVSSKRVEKATCVISGYEKLSMGKNGLTTFKLKMNKDCDLAGRWIAEATQYHHSKGYSGFSTRFNNLTVKDGVFSIPNLGNNGFEDKIIQVLYFPHSLQKPSSFIIEYWM